MFYTVNENLGDQCSKSYNLWKECEVNEFITVRLEGITHYWGESYYDEYDIDHYDEGFYFEWVPALYVKGIDKFSRAKCKERKYIRELTPSQKIQENKFTNLCSAIREWAENGYDIKYLDHELSLPLLKKLVKAGDKTAIKRIAQITSENVIVKIRGVEIHFAEANILMELEKVLEKEFIALEGRVSTICHFYSETYFYKDEYKEINENKSLWVKDNHVIQLNLQSVDELDRDNPIESLPESIGDLIFLEHLGLSLPYLKNLPESIANLTSLKRISGLIRKSERGYLWTVGIPLGHLWPKYLPQDAVKLVQYIRLKKEGKIENVVFNGKNYEIIYNHLYLHNLGIKDMNDIIGLDTINNVKYLNLGRNQISEIKGLVNLTDLKELDLSYNQISEIKGLSNLINLEKLSFWSNNIVEIKGLENLTKLKELSLGFNKIVEIKGLENLTKLKELTFSSNPISAISGLENQINLEKIYIDRRESLGNNSFRHNQFFIEFAHLSDLEKAQKYVDYCKIKKELNIDNLSIKDYIKFSNKDKLG